MPLRPPALGPATSRVLNPRVACHALSSVRCVRPADPSPLRRLQILGRADSTVKIRGFKVGLPYVEATIGALPGVARVAVVPLMDSATGQPSALVAHVLPKMSKGRRWRLKGET